MVLDAISAEDKNSCLCNGVYDVLVSHFGTRPPPQSQRKAAAKQKQHDRALKRVTRLQNEARQALRHTKRQGETGSTLHTLAANFLSLLRTHSRLRRALQRRLLQNEAKSARERCHQDFWRYVKELFEGDTSSRTSLTSPPAQHTPIYPTSTGRLPMLLRLLIGCQAPLLQIQSP